MNNDISIYRRLLRSRPAAVAIAFIIFVVTVAVLAYPLAPDDTPDANNMIVELSARPRGYNQTFLLVPKHRPPAVKSWLNSQMTGTASPFFPIPINGYLVSNDSIIVRHYIDDQLEDTLRYAFASLRIPPHTIDPATWVAQNRISQKTFILGTDRYGRDILSRLIIGARISIAVGIVSVILSLSIGILLGSVAGWYGGWVDGAIMWLINILWSIPTLLLVFAITLTIGKGFWEIFVAIGLTSWVSAARLIRGQVMQLKEMDFITAAKALGYRDSRIIFRHILPNIAGPVMVIAAANFATAILIEAGLSFLGVGVQPPTPSWGLMVKEHYNFLIAGNPLPALIPGLAIMLLVLAFNIAGNALRDAIDVRQ